MNRMPPNWTQLAMVGGVGESQKEATDSAKAVAEAAKRRADEAAAQAAARVSKVKFAGFLAIAAVLYLVLK